MNTPGIIGGLGPQTTADFYLQIQQLALKENLSQRPFMMIGSVDMPYQLEEEIFLNSGDLNKCIPYLVNTINKLEKSEVDFLVMPCNTLHILEESIRKDTTTPFLHIVEETVKEIRAQDLQKVTLLSTGALKTSRLYQSSFDKAGIKYLEPNEEDQTKIDKIISRLVNNTQTSEDRKFFNNYLEKQTDLSEAVILACTDFHILVNIDTTVKVIDTMSVLAKATFDKIIEK